MIYTYLCLCEGFYIRQMQMKVGTLHNPRARYLGEYQIEEGDLPNLKPSDILNFLKAIGMEELL